MRMAMVVTAVTFSFAVALTGVGAQAAASQDFFPSCLRKAPAAAPLVIGELGGMKLHRPLSLVALCGLKEHCECLCSNLQCKPCNLRSGLPCNVVPCTCRWTSDCRRNPECGSGKGFKFEGILCSN